MHVGWLTMKLLLTVLAFSFSAAYALHRGPGARHLGEVSNVSEDLISRCKVHQFETYLDHFGRVRCCAIFLLCVQLGAASATQSSIYRDTCLLYTLWCKS